jgi:hypothetical protein
MAGAKLTDYRNPISGQKGSLTNVGDMFGLVKGAVVLMLVYAAGAWLLAKIRGAVPARLSGLAGGGRPAAADPGAGYRVIG